MVKSSLPDTDALWQAGSLHEKTAERIMRSHTEPDRVPDRVDNALDDWLAEDNANIEAYMDGLLIWEQLGQVAPDWPSERVLKTRRWNVGAIMATMAVAVVCAFAIGWGYLSYMMPTYTTRIGEQRVVHLQDGTDVTLNTNSVLKVRFEHNLRRVQLAQGEALFDVAPNKKRPFIVEAGDGYVEAVGTSFVVRAEKGTMEVTLLSGRVDVGRGRFNTSPEVSLVPGERFRRLSSATVVDRPRLDTITAWRRGEIVLDETPLTEAIAEMNRYSERPILLSSGTAGNKKISGIVRIHEPDVFVATVASVYNLNVVRSATSVTLSGEAAP